MMDRLLYRRQFLLARQPVAELHEWNKLHVGHYCLHVHPDLKTTMAQDTTRTLTLLGYLFDPESWESSNQEILQRILITAKDFAGLVLALKPYPGRYAVFYHDRECLNLLQDALALREVYYYQGENVVVCGSQPNMLVRFSQPRIQESSDPELLDFVQNHLPGVRNGRLWVGDGTPYDAIKHLLPNHYLDLIRLESRRYWPNTPLSRIELDEAVCKCAAFLQGAMKAAAHRHPLMLAVTGGFDSRSLLAASRDVRDRVYYFINKKPPLNDSSPDIRIPSCIFARFNIPFHIHDATGPVDEEFREVFLNNVFMSTDLLLPTIYNVYFKNHQDKLNVLGVGEIGREYYGAAPPDVDGFYLAYCLKYRGSRYATAQCERWLKEAKNVAETYNVDIMRLFLWEALLGNWGAVGNSESDIAIEEFDPYDSHTIYEIMLSVDRDQGDLFEGLFKKMWPELLDFPFNPPNTFEDKVKCWLERIGLYKHLKRQRYRLDRRKFQRLGGWREG